MKYALCLIAVVLAPLAASASAPPRDGQPYAETICETDPNVLFCEDFDYPENLRCEAGGNPDTFTWDNPGLSTSGQSFTNQYCSGADWPSSSGFPLPPAGSPSGGGVYRMQPGVNPAGASLTGCILGDCDRTTADDDPTYENGSAASNDLYFRFQIYNDANWYWPVEADNKVLFLYPNKYTGKTDANVDAGLFFAAAGRCPTAYNDAVSFRVGSNSGGYKFYPAHANVLGGYQGHTEYCTGVGAPNGSAGDDTAAVDTSTPPTAEPNPGTLFRMIAGRWYTVEFRYQLSGAGMQNGTIEAWIDGVKVYGDSDLETCGGFGADEGSCDAIHEIFLEGSWYNPFTGDADAAQARGSYRLIDNFVISTSYIGPPGQPGSGGDAGAGPDPGDVGGGCGCRASGADGLPFALMVIASFVLRRRARRR